MYKNLEALRKQYGQNQAEFAETLGLPANTYRNYEKRIREPTSDFWISVAEKYKVSIDYLMGFSDDPHRVKFAGPSELEKKYRALDEHGKKVVDFILEVETERIADAKTEIIDFGTIRHYFSSPAAGPNGILVGTECEDIPRTAEMPPDADYCLTVNGDSMEPYIFDGQLVFVKRDVPVNPYEVGVFYYQGGTYIKQYAETDDCVLLLSANPDRESANITIAKEYSSDLYCLGKVLGLRKLPKPVYNGSL